MKSVKLIISLVTALLLLAAAVSAAIIFQEELAKLYGQCKAYCTKALGIKNDEYADFADV